MSRAARWASTLGLSLSLGVTAAHGDPCDGPVLEAGVPARIPLGPAGFGAPPEACPANDLSLQGSGAALIATEDFYGGLTAGLAFRGRFDLGAGHSVSIWVPGLEYRFFANATIEAEAVTMGAGALGYHLSLRIGRGVRVGPYARLLLPTESAYRNAERYGFDHGLSGVWRAAPRLEVVAGAGFPFLATVSSGTYHLSHQPNLSLEAAFAPARFFAVQAGAGLRLRAGDHSGFESFDPRLALRFYPYGGSRVELAAAAPLWGADRTDLVLGLNVGYRLEDD